MDIKRIKAIAAVAVALAAAGPAAASAQGAGAGDEAERTIVEVAAASSDFETLVQAVQAAGLVDTLNGEGPFTVFAPTDDAFAKLPAGTLEALLADREALVAVLTYHVVPGKVMAADVIEAQQVSARTVQGEPLDVRVRDGAVWVDQATVVTPDVEASNGVIHVIDTVILPPSMQASADR